MKVNDYFDAVYLINLQRRLDRLEDVTQELCNHNISFTRINAVDAENEKINPSTACRLSHISVLERSQGKTLIFEDDAIFMENFEENFSQAIQTLPDDWDIMYLGAYVLKSEPVNKQWIRLLQGSSTHAYSIHPNKVNYFIDAAKNFDGHIDVCYSNHFPKIKAYACQPTLVKQKPSYSDIVKNDVDYMSWYK